MLSIPGIIALASSRFCTLYLVQPSYGTTPAESHHKQQMGVLVTPLAADRYTGRKRVALQRATTHLSLQSYIEPSL
jgi:hypothetical protein